MITVETRLPHRPKPFVLLEGEGFPLLHNTRISFRKGRDISLETYYKCNSDVIVEEGTLQVEAELNQKDRKGSDYFLSVKVVGEEADNLSPILRLGGITYRATMTPEIHRSARGRVFLKLGNTYKDWVSENGTNLRFKSPIDKYTQQQLGQALELYFEKSNPPAV